MRPPLCPLTVAAVPVLGAGLPLAPAPHLQPEDVSEMCRSGELGAKRRHRGVGRARTVTPEPTQGRPAGGPTWGADSSSVPEARGPEPSSGGRGAHLPPAPPAPRGQ